MSDGSASTSEADLSAAWQAAVDRLSPGARVWVFPAVPLSFHNDIVIAAVQNDLARAQLESRVRPVLEQALSRELGTEVRLVVTIDASISPPEALVPDEIPNRHTVLDLDEDDDEDHFVPQWGPAPTPVTGRPANIAEARLNPRYLFENFVTGSSNRFAHAAAVATAEAPGKAYNPLVIYGDSGLGKTHLLHAIGHYVLGLYPSSRVRYVNTEEFTNDVINAIGERRTGELKRKYREIDVLLVDDIQFIEGKEATQEEFFHTFNALHNENKQIVMTSDRPPKNLKTLEERLRNRFEWGLTTDVTPPELETRIAILRKKAANDGLTVPADVLEFIATKVQTNIRELEGALIRVTAFANLNKTPVDMNLSQIVLKDLVSAGGDPEVTSALIIAQTSAYSEFSIEEICGTNRSRDLVLARQIGMYLCRELTEMSLPKIGQEFGGRDHTTVMHAVRKIGALMTEKHAVFNQVTELTNRIKQQARQS
ncbi:chromosomal replication initiator protein DnaA [Aeromicrobium sp. Leaf350]|uniref:chromosomal replication initiator protein DnaA n=1 Tax=Aeromicrobium sp. Leaf350 TaxID=2876565 RepID=UPI001E530099|nr:chromosomal replication initiator protein DnaA [Aeromicrobium sp. Leaf350]